MTEQTSSPIPAGWYPDPAGSARKRWWDGTAWTSHFEEPYTGAGVVLKAPEGTKVYNSPWIWLVVFVPYLSLPLLFTLDFSSIFNERVLSDPTASSQAQLALMTSPAYLGLILAGFITSALVVLFSYLDWKWLNRAGVPKPFHWAWGFFSIMGYPVYAIGRAVVTKRRTGHGSAVMWAAIGMIVLTFIVAIGWTISLVVQVTELVSRY